MRLRLQELQGKNKQARKLRAEQPVKNGKKDINGILYHKGLLYVLEIIQTELISKHQHNLLVGHFSIEKILKLIAQKYYWPMLCHDVDNYVKGCNVCLASKTV